MSSGPFVLPTGGHAARSSRCDGNPSLRSWAPLSITASRGYQRHSPCSRLEIACLNSSVCISPGTHQRISQVSSPMLHAWWKAKAGMLAASPASRRTTSDVSGFESMSDPRST